MLSWEANQREPDRLSALWFQRPLQPARAAGNNHVRQHEALIGGLGGADQMDIVVVDILLVLSNTQAGPTDQV